jgi:hypothetical protein
MGMIIVETATASPTFSRFMKSAYGAGCRDMGRTVMVLIVLSAPGHRLGESNGQLTLSVYSDV